MMNRWVLFENDKCDECQHPKIMKLCPPPKKGSTLQVIISCDCDMTVFDHAWKHARDSGELIVMVGETTIMETVALIAESLGGKKK